MNRPEPLVFWAYVLVIGCLIGVGLSIWAHYA